MNINLNELYSVIIGLDAKHCALGWLWVGVVGYISWMYCYELYKIRKHSFHCQSANFGVILMLALVAVSFVYTLVSYDTLFAVKYITSFNGVFISMIYAIASRLFIQSLRGTRKRQRERMKLSPMDASTIADIVPTH